MRTILGITDGDDAGAVLAGAVANAGATSIPMAARYATARAQRCITNMILPPHESKRSCSGLVFVNTFGTTGAALLDLKTRIGRRFAKLQFSAKL